MRPFIFTLKLLLTLIILGDCSLITAQETEFLRGKVLDQKTGEPVVFATVRIKGKAKGVVTNTDGSFRLPLSFREAGESIQISSMGYEKKEFELLKLSPTDINILRLNPGVFSLTEAIVSARKKREPSAKKIVQRAIENIPNNYPTSNFTTKGYYRDYQLDSLGYLNLNEALLQVFDYGFNEIDSATTKIRIYDYYENMNFRRDTLADDSYNYKDWRKIIDNAYLESHGGNEVTILRVHDAIRNYRINSFDFINSMQDGDVLKNHSFKKLTKTYLDGEPLYTIQLKKSHPNYVARGILYISQNDYAIHKLEYAVYDDQKRNKDLKLRNEGIKGQLIFEVTTEYKRKEDYKMYLNYISFHNTFQLSLPPKFIIQDLMVSAKNGIFVFNLNNKIALNTDITDNKLYDIKYKDQKLKFKKMLVLNDSAIVLYPSMNQKSLDNMMRELVVMTRKKLDIASVLKFEVNDIYDVDGNLLNQRTLKDYDQFREFFAQETEKMFQLPQDSLLMNKRRPIFEDQPISKPMDYGDYWMNTPLKTIQE